MENGAVVAVFTLYIIMVSQWRGLVNGEPVVMKKYKQKALPYWPFCSFFAPR